MPGKAAAIFLNSACIHSQVHGREEHQWMHKLVTHTFNVQIFSFIKFSGNQDMLQLP